MNKEIKERWLAALRSGEYEQGTGLLQSESGNYCCLGVLCDIHAKETDGEWLFDGVDKTYDGNYDVLPQSVKAWAELPSTCGASLQFDDEGWQSSLDITEMNDTGWTFAELADLIEEQL